MMTSLSKYKYNSSTIYCNVVLSDITHLNEIQKVLVASHFTKNKWLPLGLNLGLYKTTLDAIEAKYKDDVDRCLLECLSAWLNKVDSVRSEGDPNWILLTSALREIDQNAVADNVDRQSKSINSNVLLIQFIEQPAYFILHQYHAALSKNLTNPDNVAVLLQKEKILTEEVVTSIETKASLPEKRKVLLTSVQYAVCTNPHNLLVFGVVLKKFTSSVSQAILNDYSEYM